MKHVVNVVNICLSFIYGFSVMLLMLLCLPKYMSGKPSIKIVVCGFQGQPSTGIGAVWRGFKDTRVLATYRWHKEASSLIPGRPLWALGCRPCSASSGRSGARKQGGQARDAAKSRTYTRDLAYSRYHVRLPLVDFPAGSTTATSTKQSQQWGKSQILFYSFTNIRSLKRHL